MTMPKTASKKFSKYAAGQEEDDDTGGGFVPDFLRLQWKVIERDGTDRWVTSPPLEPADTIPCGYWRKKTAEMAKLPMFFCGLVRAVSITSIRLALDDATR